MITPKRYKICRRVGDRIYPQCQTPRYAASLANRKPTRSKGGFGGKTDFAAQLTEKQKVRFAYGVSERQFSNYVKAAREAKGAVTQTLYTMLEMRLDNVVYRLGLASSRRAARQMVSHGHILVNGTRITIPSYQVKKSDVLSVRQGSRSSSLFGNMNEKLKEHRTPEWLSLKADALEAHVLATPKPTELTDANVNLNAIVEFYSR